eukprot:COSAG03_NODE_1651_length_3716_cov_2.353608_1_plen_173_part_10
MAKVRSDHCCSGVVRAARVFDRVGRDPAAARWRSSGILSCSSECSAPRVTMMSAATLKHSKSQNVGEEIQVFQKKARRIRQTVLYSYCTCRPYLLVTERLDTHPAVICPVVIWPRPQILSPGPTDALTHGLRPATGYRAYRVLHGAVAPYTGLAPSLFDGFSGLLWPTGSVRQ